jgi:NADH-quinone oxidoreductase subunit H
VSQFSVPWNDRRQLELRGPSRLIAAAATAVYRLAGPIVGRFPGPILLGAIVVAILATWAHFGLFGVVTGFANDPAINTPAESVWGLPLTPAEIETGLTQRGWPATGLLKYLLWPMQAEILRDLIGLGAVFGLFNLFPVFAIWWERKVAGRIQSRMGPMRVGGWHGWAQSFADGVKLVSKEDIVPGTADKPLFLLAPYLAMVPALLSFLCLPFGAYWVFRNIDVALVFILAMLGVEVVGVIVAGWASNNKWSVYGAMREACQMVSYEIPMTTVLLVPVMAAGTLNMIDIGEAQRGGWHTWVAFHNPFTFIAFITYFIASLASCKRAPFDLPESESELVAGFHTEYSGFRWALFFFAEYAAMFVVGGLAVTLFLGAWHTGLPPAVGAWITQTLGDNVFSQGLNGLLVSGPVWFIAKCIFVVWLQIWIRWTLPRIRIDQVLYSCVQVMFPIALVALVGHSAWMLIPTDHWVYRGCNVVLSAIGLITVVVIIAIAVYGFRHGKRMVGYLAVKQLPGA